MQDDVQPVTVLAFCLLQYQWVEELADWTIGCHRAFDHPLCIVDRIVR